LLLEQLEMEGKKSVFNKSRQGLRP
jgi:hypothetical protein